MGRNKLETVEKVVYDFDIDPSRKDIKKAFKTLKRNNLTQEERKNFLAKNRGITTCIAKNDRGKELAHTFIFTDYNHKYSYENMELGKERLKNLLKGKVSKNFKNW